MSEEIEESENLAWQMFKSRFQAWDNWDKGQRGNTVGGRFEKRNAWLGKEPYLQMILDTNLWLNT